MKILHIGQLIGGLDIYIRNTIIYSNKSFNFIIAHGTADKNQPIIKNGEKIKEYPISLYRNLNPFKDIKGLIQVLKIIHKEKPDLIHCHSAKGGFIGRIAGYLTHTKTFYTPHAFSFLSAQNNIKKQIYLFLERFARLDSYLLACSNSEKALGINLVHYKTNKALVWSNSVPDARNISVLPKNINSPYVCYIGRPSYQKNPFFLVNVIKKVHKKHPDILFYILGVGYYSPDLEKMQQIIKDYQLENTIILLPWLNHDETMGYVKNSLFYLTTSRYEGLPLAVIEAMSLKKCIIASDVPGNQDCVQNQYNGFLLPLNEDIFANKINELIENPREREFYANNSRKYFEKEFLIQNRIQLLEQIYNNKLNS
ncbi:glycosyltransferase [uncultured Bacteroides sp.]|uniref:glycosyltransferase n=1 Tax=uncultured Bacteroides sp. TaxID=162156 RepID=UPI00262F7FCE|nr:glycosyltransferase [uncultured Bacteroides sp.]